MRAGTPNISCAPSVVLRSPTISFASMKVDHIATLILPNSAHIGVQNANNPFSVKCLKRSTRNGIWNASHVSMMDIELERGNRFIMLLVTSQREREKKFGVLNTMNSNSWNDAPPVHNPSKDSISKCRTSSFTASVGAVLSVKRSCSRRMLQLIKRVKILFAKIV